MLRIGPLPKLTRRKALALLILGYVLSGCSSTRVANVTEGRSLPTGADAHASREAARTIEVTTTTPEGAVELGPVEAGRGHRDWRNAAPTREDLIHDLKIAAYTRGADGISGIEISKKRGLSDNYWWVLQGRAVAWRRDSEGD